MNYYCTLPRLAAATERDLAAALREIAELLKGFDEPARIQVTIKRNKRQSCWSLELSQNACRLHSKETNRPDFEIITKEEVWWQIAEGSLAPVRAFYEHKMGLRGNILLGERLLMRLAAQKGKSEEKVQ